MVGYEIFYTMTEVDDLDKWQRKSVGLTTSAELINLERDARYAIAVAARTHDGLGRLSQRINEKVRPQDVVLSLRAQAVTTHTMPPVRTAALASEVGVSREHLSRHFSTPGAPNLKRVIDLVRMISAAELAKNPGLDIRDVAKILGFASSSHLAVTAQRVLGTRPASLSRLRTVDLIDRFTQGRTRSRG